jgi:hypothetical protein
LAWSFGGYGGDAAYGTPDVEGWYGARRSFTNYAPIRYGTTTVAPAYTIDSSSNEPVAVNSNPSVQAAQCAADGRTGYLRWTQVNFSNIGLYTLEYQVSTANVTNMSFDIATVSGAGAATDNRLLVHLGSDWANGWYVSDQGFTSTALDTWETATFNFQALTWGLSTNPGASINGTWPVAGKNPYAYFNAITTTGLALPSDTINAFGLFIPSSLAQRKLDNFTILGVPEPMTMSLLAIGVVGLIRRK